MKESRTWRQVRDLIAPGMRTSLGCLCSQLFSECLLEPKRAYGDESDRDSSLLAWRARNLLELTVWSL